MQLEISNFIPYEHMVFNEIIVIQHWRVLIIVWLKKLHYLHMYGFYWQFTEITFQGCRLQHGVTGLIHVLAKSRQHATIYTNVG